MKIAIVGLGYVGIQLAVQFGRHNETIGYDLDESKIDAYKKFLDPTGEVTEQELRLADRLSFTHTIDALTGCKVYIVAVPTPVDNAHRPDFSFLVEASRAVAKVLTSGAIVVYESTVYPGATEEVCVPELERNSGLTWKKDFHIGYSPERINPGDQDHTLTKIVKLVSADDDETLNILTELYGSIITAGVFPVSSIRVAEAAKVIENTQRDLNIALVNELAIIFDRMGLDSTEVLEAAGTKWNFLPFRPGLVGGHCIGVDPYYLTYKAQMLGYHPDVILAGRRINDSMGKFVAERTIKQMLLAGRDIKHSQVNVLGITFKEDCSDLRNSKVFSLVSELQSYGVTVKICDPIADTTQIKQQYGIDITEWDDLPEADALVLAVAHSEFVEKNTGNLLSKLHQEGVFVDVKSVRDASEIESLGHTVWRL